jgi:hypothetical protein
LRNDAPFDRDIIATQRGTDIIDLKSFERDRRQTGFIAPQGVSPSKAW